PTPCCSMRIDAASCTTSTTCSRPPCVREMRPGLSASSRATSVAPAANCRSTPRSSPEAQNPEAAALQQVAAADLGDRTAVAVLQLSIGEGALEHSDERGHRREIHAARGSDVVGELQVFATQLDVE